MIPRSGRSTGEGIGYPLQCSGLENSMDYIIYMYILYSPWGRKESDTTERLSLSLPVVTGFLYCSHCGPQNYKSDLFMSLLETSYPLQVKIQAL